MSDYVMRDFKMAGGTERLKHKNEVEDGGQDSRVSVNKIALSYHSICTLKCLDVCKDTRMCACGWGKREEKALGVKQRRSQVPWKDTIAVPLSLSSTCDLGFISCGLTNKVQFRFCGRNSHKHSPTTWDNTINLGCYTETSSKHNYWGISNSNNRTLDIVR